jgi:zinc transport system substrate-binding protein
MKKIIVTIFIIIAVIIIVFSLQGESTVTNEPESTQDSITIATTIYPLYDFVSQVVGDTADVVLMLPPGASPHTFELQPSLLRDLQDVEYVFAIGNGLDDWTGDVSESIGATVVTVDEGIDLRETGYDDHDHHEHEHEDNDDHEHGPIDPHYWLSPSHAQIIVSTIEETLSLAYHQYHDVYQENSIRYQQELANLQIELQEQIQPFSGTRIITLHDAWYYFAQEFGIRIEGTFEPAAGTNPSPQYLEDLLTTVREHNTSLIVLEPQLSSDGIRSFADDTGIAIAVLDPIGGVEGRNSYIELMRYNVRNLIEGLSTDE